jgi:hypothetical protein
MKALKGRLARHWGFQAAQRLQQGRLEEAAASSGGRVWFMKVDKMDQQKCVLPCVWGLLRTPLFKLGERLQVSVIGAHWSGPRSTEWHIRTAFDDTAHGSEMQCSAVLQNLHEMCLKEQTVPSEFIVGADNTPKETKNSIFITFVCWMLCALERTPLWSVLMGFLLVGHTHDALDRFFSRLAVSLSGHDFYTVDEMLATARKGLPSFRFAASHLAQVWAWKELQQQGVMPAISKLRNVHCLNIFRNRGIWIKWKQYMTDDTWSRPILLVPPEKMQAFGALRPNLVPHPYTLTAPGASRRHVGLFRPVGVRVHSQAHFPVQRGNVRSFAQVAIHAGKSLRSNRPFSLISILSPGGPGAADPPFWSPSSHHAPLVPLVSSRSEAQSVYRARQDARVG